MNNNPRKEVDSKIILKDPSDEGDVEQYARIKKEADSHTGIQSLL